MWVGNLYLPLDNLFEFKIQKECPKPHNGYLKLMQSLKNQRKIAQLNKQKYNDAALLIYPLIDEYHNEAIL